MSDSKDFTAGVDSNAKKSPRRIVFITRRTSAQVKAETEHQMQTFPEVLFRAAVAIMTLAVVLVWISLMFNAPLEGLADPSHTPNPAKAPWYFLGLQEMLHYFPPVVAGVLVPGLVVMALIVIPYFKVNIEADGLFLKDRQRRLRIFYLVAAALLVFLLLFKVYAALVPTLIMAGLMLLAAQSSFGCRRHGAGVGPQHGPGASRSVRAGLLHRSSGQSRSGTVPRKAGDRRNFQASRNSRDPPAEHQRGAICRCLGSLDRPRAADELASENSSRANRFHESHPRRRDHLGALHRRKWA